MLKQFAQEKITATDVIGFPETPANKKIALSQRQDELVNHIRTAGGVLEGADLEAVGDKRTLNALERKGVICRKGATQYSLIDVFVEPDEDRNKKIFMTGSEFAAALDALYGYGGQSKFAALIGVNKATVGKWAQGKLDVPQYAVVLLSTLQHCREVGAPMPHFPGL